MCHGERPPPPSRSARASAHEGERAQGRARSRGRPCVGRRVLPYKGGMQAVWCTTTTLRADAVGAHTRTRCAGTECGVGDRGSARQRRQLSGHPRWSCQLRRIFPCPPPSSTVRLAHPRWKSLPGRTPASDGRGALPESGRRARMRNAAAGATAHCRARVRCMAEGDADGWAQGRCRWQRMHGCTISCVF